MNESRSYKWTGAGGPFTLAVDEGVFTPSSTSRVLGDAMQVREGDTVLDAGCGCGVLSFAAARLGAARVIGCDVSPAAVECATKNARELGLSDITEFRCGSLFEPVQDIRADIVIADVSGIPDVIAKTTGWFPDGHGGGPTGAELPVAMLDGLADHIAPGGHAYLPTGSIQDESRVLQAARQVFGDGMQAVATRDFPLPETITRARDVARLLSDGVIRLTRRGSRFFWRLTIWRCSPS